jgi:hypothetical protein
MTREEALRLLGLNEDATEEDIKLAYKEMAQILHPDKYADNKRLAERATEQFKHVNEAREVLLGRKASRRRGAARARSGAGGRARESADAGPADRAASLKARLAGIAAARTQLIAQLDAERDRRRIGLFLLVGGILAAIVGRVIRPLLAVTSVALVWGGIQLFTSQASIRLINGHLAELAKERERCEKELDEL